MKSSLWVIPVQWGQKHRELWFETSELEKAKEPPVCKGTPSPDSYKRDLNCFEGPSTLHPIKLKGAWIHEPGKIICDRAELA